LGQIRARIGHYRAEPEASGYFADLMQLVLGNQI
jgi:hypothetical protein